MTNQSKSFAIILSTLLLGILIGVLASGTLRNQREKRYDRMPPSKRFENFVEHVIEPTGEQKQQYAAKMERWSGALAEIHRRHQNELIAIYDSLRADLSSILTEEQKARLEQHLVSGGRKLIDLRFERLVEALELTEQQQGELDEILTPMREEFRRPSRGKRQDWETRQRMMHARVEQIENEILAILTPEQRDKFQELKNQYPQPFRRPFRGRAPKGRPPFPGPAGRPE